jgi:hypothetical protein
MVNIFFIHFTFLGYSALFLKIVLKYKIDFYVYVYILIFMNGYHFNI